MLAWMLVDSTLDALTVDITPHESSGKIQSAASGSRSVGVAVGTLFVSLLGPRIGWTPVLVALGAGALLQSIVPLFHPGESNYFRKLEEPTAAESCDPLHLQPPPGVVRHVFLLVFLCDFGISASDLGLYPYRVGLERQHRDDDDVWICQGSKFDQQRPWRLYCWALASQNHHIVPVLCGLFSPLLDIKPALAGGGSLPA